MRCFTRSLEFPLAVFRCLVIAGALSAWCGAFACAQAKANPPVPRINSIFSGPVWRADVDASERFAVVSNADQALMLWTLDDRPDADSQKLARVPLRDEQRRPARPVAISANGELAAYGVPPEVDKNMRLNPWSGRIYILRRVSGHIVHTITGSQSGLSSRSLALRFSPDGQWLAAALSGGCGVRVWSTRTWKLAFQDDVGYDPGNVASAGCCPGDDAVECDKRGDSWGLLFPRPGQGRPWLLVSGDTGLHAYDRAGETVAIRPLMRPADIGLERPGGLAESPDGRRLAVGERRNRQRGGDPACRIHLRVAVIDVSTLVAAGPQPAIGTSSVVSEGLLTCTDDFAGMDQMGLERVAWVSDGDREFIFGAGALHCQIARKRSSGVGLKDICIARWQVGNLEADPNFIGVGGTDRVMDIIGLNRRGGILIATQRGVGVYNVEGVLTQHPGTGKPVAFRNRAIDYRDGQLGFRISADARVVSAADYSRQSDGPKGITVDTYPLKVTEGTEPGLADINPNQDPNIVGEPINWKNRIGSSPIILGKPLPGNEFGKDEWSRSVAVLHDKQIVVLASSQFLRVVSFEEEAPAVMCRAAMREDTFRVNIIQDGSIIVSAHGDGTLRWHRTNIVGRTCQLELLLTAYISETDSGKLAAMVWQPSGKFDLNHDAMEGRDALYGKLISWQIIDGDGKVVQIPFGPKRIKDYDNGIGRRALAPPPLSRQREEIGKVETPTAEELVKNVERAISLEGTYRDLKKSRVPIRLAVNDARGWPKRLVLRMNEAGVPKHHGGQNYGAFEPIVIEKRMLNEGVLTIEIDIPASILATKGEKQLCYFLDGHRDSCDKIVWTGETLRPKLRRLWAVLIGMSAHDNSRMTLRFAENDAIDLARLYVRAPTTGAAAPPEFLSRHINLVVSPSSSETEDEMDKLAEAGDVRLFPPTKAGIIEAFVDIEGRAAKANDEEAGDDLFLFLFSGHGGVHPYRKSVGDGHTIFATSETPLSPSRESIEDTALTSAELFRLLDRVPGQKVVILDSCRTLADMPFAEPFDPKLARQELEQVLSAHFFHSSRDGQPSRESAHLAFDSGRPAGRRGNSVFSFALLSALNDPRATYPISAGERLGVEIEGVKNLIVREFFNPENASSPVVQAAKAEGWTILQTPLYRPALESFTWSVIRMLNQ